MQIQNNTVRPRKLETATMQSKPSVDNLRGEGGTRPMTSIQKVTPAANNLSKQQKLMIDSYF